MSEYKHHAVKAYHGEIGREATASDSTSADALVAYHGEIGREATAVVTR